MIHGNFFHAVIRPGCHGEFWSGIAAEYTLLREGLTTQCAYQGTSIPRWVKMGTSQGARRLVDLARYAGCCYSSASCQIGFGWISATLFQRQQSQKCSRNLSPLPKGFLRPWLTSEGARNSSRPGRKLLLHVFGTYNCRRRPQRFFGNVASHGRSAQDQSGRLRTDYLPKPWLLHSPDHHEFCLLAGRLSKVEVAEPVWSHDIDSSSFSPETR